MTSSPSVGQRIKNEFRKECFLLNFDSPDAFARAELSRGPSVLYVLWRVFWAIFHLGCMAVAAAYVCLVWASTEPNRVKFFLPLTNWCYVVLTLTALVDAIVSVYVYANRDNLRDKFRMSWYCKTLWILSNVTNATALFTCVLYWPLVYKPTVGLEGLRITSFLVHGMNAIYVVFNLLLTAMPTRLLHFYQPVVFGLIYGVFNAIYVLAGGTNWQDEPHIYKFLDWNKSPGFSAGLSVGCLFGVFIMHVLVYFIHLARVHVCAKYTNATTVGVLKEPSRTLSESS